MKVSRQVRGESGFTLLELAVVSLILTVLVTIVGLAVSGRGTESRAAAQVSDEATLQRAVDRFSGEHPQGRYPTLNGCLPGRILDLISLECVIPGRESSPVRVNTNNLEFVFDESIAGIDLNEDGNLDDSFKVAPIIWHKAFKAEVVLSRKGQVKRFLGDFVERAPKHAFDFLRGTDKNNSWEDGESFDPDGLGNNDIDISRITAPAGLGPGENRINVSIGQVPVWVLGVFKPTGGVQVQSLLPDSRY